MKTTLTRADALIAGGAIATLLFSFFGFFEFSTAWSTSGFAFASTIPAILALVTVIWYGCEAAGVQLPGQLLSFTPPQLKAVWAIVAMVTMFAWITVDVRKDALFWIQMLGTVAMTAGAVAALKGKLSEPLISETAGGPAAAVPPPPGAPTPSPPAAPQAPPAASEPSGN